MGGQRPGEAAADLEKVGGRLEVLMAQVRQLGHSPLYEALQEELTLWQEAYERELDQSRKDYCQLRQTMDEFLRLHAVSADIGSSFKLDQIFSRLLATVRRFMPIDSCGVYLAGIEPGCPSAALIEGDQSQLQTQLEVLWREGMVEWAWREDRPLVVGDPSVGERAWVVAPLVLRGVPLGLYLGRCNRVRRQLGADRLGLLGAMGRQAALAVENARLYTELETAHSKFKTSQAQLIDTARQAALGQMAGSVAHEVNNPLQNMLGRVQLMRLENLGDATVVEGLELIEANIKRIARISQALMGFARTRAVGGDRLCFTPAAALGQACQLTKAQLEIQLIELVVDCPDQLPELRGDMGELVQVFINLINNAQNAMVRGGNLHIAVGQRGANIEFAFTDTGSGIAPRDLDRLFEPFFSTRSAEGGTGLGLAVSQRIITEMGGTIKVDSTVGQGTTFTVCVPVDREGEQDGG